MSREELVYYVLDQMYEDVNNNRLDGIRKLLAFVPDAELIAYIPKEEQDNDD